jgi:hypothetical protein
MRLGGVQGPGCRTRTSGDRCRRPRSQLYSRLARCLNRSATCLILRLSGSPAIAPTSFQGIQRTHSLTCKELFQLSVKRVPNINYRRWGAVPVLDESARFVFSLYSLKYFAISPWRYSVKMLKLHCRIFMVMPSVATLDLDGV